MNTLVRLARWFVHLGTAYFCVSLSVLHLYGYPYLTHDATQLVQRLLILVTQVNDVVTIAFA